MNLRPRLFQPIRTGSQTDAIAQIQRIRWWRRELETLVTGVLIAGLLWPAWVDIRHHGSFDSATWWLLAAMVVCGKPLANSALDAAEGRLLAAAAGAPVGEPAPMDLHRRVGPWRHILTASTWLMGGVAWAWVDSVHEHTTLWGRSWLFYLLTAFMTVLYAAGALLPFPWGSDVGRLDETGLTLRGSDLKVPWQLIAYVSAETSVGDITWHFADGSQRAQVVRASLREKPEDVIRVSGQYLLAARATEAESPLPRSGAPA